MLDGDRGRTETCSLPLANHSMPAWPTVVVSPTMLVLGGRAKGRSRSANPWSCVSGRPGHWLECHRAPGLRSREGSEGSVEHWPRLPRLAWTGPPLSVPSYPVFSNNYYLMVYQTQTRQVLIIIQFSVRHVSARPFGMALLTPPLSPARAADPAGPCLGKASTKDDLSQKGRFFSLWTVPLEASFALAPPVPSPRPLLGPGCPGQTHLLP